MFLNKIGGKGVREWERRLLVVYGRSKLLVVLTGEIMDIPGKQRRVVWQVEYSFEIWGHEFSETSHYGVCFSNSEIHRLNEGKLRFLYSKLLLKI